MFIAGVGRRYFLNIPENKSSAGASSGTIEGWSIVSVL
jgi:hypothetical protein